MLPVEYYYHNLVGKASQGDTFYVIFSDFLKVYKTLKILNILKNSPPVKHCLHIFCDIDLTLIAKIRSDCQDWGLSYLAVHCGIVSSSKGWVLSVCLWWSRSRTNLRICTKKLILLTSVIDELWIIRWIPILEVVSKTWIRIFQHVKKNT